MRTIDKVLSHLPKNRTPPAAAPTYHYKPEGPRLGLAVQSMSEHMTDEGWQIFEGLSHNNYILCGHNLPEPSTVVPTLIQKYQPSVVFLQDKREWAPSHRDFRDRNARFTGVVALARRPDIFKLTILKDAQHRPHYHKQSANEIGCHAWVCYYHPRIVKHIANYVRSEHIIRTYHTINTAHLPPFNSTRKPALLSGAVSPAYPFRTAIVQRIRQFPDLAYLHHPGYHRRGCHTPAYLAEIAKYKVHVCTTSMYGYCLRKIIESVAVGTIPLTDLPTDDILPHIQPALVHFSADNSIAEINDIIANLVSNYNIEERYYYATLAQTYYSHIYQTALLAQNIETLRKNY